MSIDLQLFFLMGPRDLQDTRVLVVNSLHMDQDYRVFGQLTEMEAYAQDDPSIPTTPTIKTHPIPAQLWVGIYGDTGLEDSREDAYGDELTFVYAEQMKKLVLPDDASSWNKAIMAMIRKLPNDTPIILYWS